MLPSPPPPSEDVVPIPDVPVNYRDILFKTFWTIVAFAVGLTGTALVEIHPGFAVIISGIVNYITALIRQYYGVTPPDISRSEPVSRHWPVA